MAFTLQDLINAGLPALSTDGNNELAASQFSRTLTPAEWRTYLSIANPLEYRKNVSKTFAIAIPNWATWTQAQWAAYRDANISATQINAITNIAGAIVVLNKMSTVIDSLAKMSIAERDYTRIVE